MEKQEILQIVNAKVKELELKLNKKIIPFCNLLNDEYIVGYATEPSRDAKAFGLAKVAKSTLIAGMELLKYCLIPEESDIRYFSTDSKYDALVFSASVKMINSIEILIDECIEIAI